MHQIQDILSLIGPTLFSRRRSFVIVKKRFLFINAHRHTDTQFVFSINCLLQLPLPTKYRFAIPVPIFSYWTITPLYSFSDGAKFIETFLFKSIYSKVIPFFIVQIFLLLLANFITENTVNSNMFCKKLRACRLVVNTLHVPLIAVKQ